MCILSCQNLCLVKLPLSTIYIEQKVRNSKCRKGRQRKSKPFPQHDFHSNSKTCRTISYGCFCLFLLFSRQHTTCQHKNYCTKHSPQNTAQNFCKTEFSQLFAFAFAFHIKLQFFAHQITNSTAVNIVMPPAAVTNIELTIYQSATKK